MKLKKTIAMLLSAAMMTGALAACGSSQAPANNADGADSSTPDAGTSQSASDFDTSKEISVCSREDGSGTRGAFIELFGVEKKNDAGEKVDYTTEDANITNSTSVMMTTVAGNPYAIGYCSLGSLNDTVKAVKINGAEATVDNIKSGTYEVSRPFNIVTGDSLTPLGQDFIDFILSADGQAVVEENGYISVVDGQPYAGQGGEGTIVVAGSSSVTPVMEKLAEAYEAINTGVDVQVQQSDSTTGVQNAMDGTCEIGMASRELKDSETGVTATVIAQDGIAVIVNQENPVDDLTTEQVAAIYTGETTVWSDVEG